MPASFDEVARNLTAEAAEAAGLGKVTLLEEPLAAFYAWTAQAGKEWRDQVAPGDIVLVCDVGGGTADFSLIAVTERDGELELERISVGEHILLGGDNMDLALAYALRAKLEAEGKAIDDWQFLALVHAAATAKVALFEDDRASRRRSPCRRAAPACSPGRSRPGSTGRRSSRSFSMVSSRRTEVTDLPRRGPARRPARNSACPTRPIPWSASISPAFSLGAWRT